MSFSGSVVLVPETLLSAASFIVLVLTRLTCGYSSFFGLLVPQPPSERAGN
ncbi:MAG: hypothetical protein E6121_04300 [Varibaculum cambriense]|uniref:hypothetical protein n=1 Tax=Varibaculum cambriense TaxID=184870 RepID=UPI000417E287|nr:hypothetical protein [Varibaculum cambriense]MDU4244291.1 hypothetical protein [Varibaculum cambriense]MDU5316351.1 hypothetical protein [Varibaculum cambriense]MDU5614704.1 hypothetical protein [Varibaculum cambriense]MDU7407713.1 hypothetical protein [Varibaculum cambriense]